MPAAVVFRRVVVALERIAVGATVQAGFVRADVDAFDAVAHLPLVFVFFRSYGITGDPLDQPAVDAHSGRNPQMTQIDLHGAGFQRNRVRFQRPDERLRHDFDLVPAQRTDAQLTQRTANMTIMVDKSEHALRGMVAQGTGDSGDRSQRRPDTLDRLHQRHVGESRGGKRETEDAEPRHAVGFDPDAARQQAAEDKIERPPAP